MPWQTRLLEKDTKTQIFMRMSSFSLWELRISTLWDKACRKWWSVSTTNQHYHDTVDCIYPWTHSYKTCFHMTSNIYVSGIKLWSFPTLMWSSLDIRSLSSQSKCVPNLRKSLHWHIESRKSIKDLLREVDEDLVIYDGELQSNDRPGNFIFGRENFKVWHLKRTRLTSFENMFCAPGCSRVDAIDGKSETQVTLYCCQCDVLTELLLILHIFFFLWNSTDWAKLF